MCPFAGVSRCKHVRDGRNWSLLARRLRALTTGLPLCPDELKVWSESVALICQELVFGERRSLIKTDGPPAGSKRHTILWAILWRKRLTRTFCLSSSSCCLHLWPAAVSRRRAVIMRLLTTGVSAEQALAFCYMY